MFLTGQSVDRLHVFTHLTRVCLRELSLHLTNQILLQTSANHVSALKLKPLSYNFITMESYRQDVLILFCINGNESSCSLKKPPVNLFCCSDISLFMRRI